MILQGQSMQDMRHTFLLSWSITNCFPEVHKENSPASFFRCLEVVGLFLTGSTVFWSSVWLWQQLATPFPPCNRGAHAWCIQIKLLYSLNVRYPLQGSWAPVWAADSRKGFGALMSFLISSTLIFPDKWVQASAKQGLSHCRCQYQPIESTLPLEQAAVP